MSIELINETELLNKLEGDEALLRELIDIFREQSGPDLQEVLNAVSRQDAEALYRAAHKLKGTVSLFGSEETTEAALALEVMGRDGDLSQAQTALACLQQRLERLQQSLAALREKHCPKS